MGKKELSGRLNWERLAGEKAANAEQNLYKAFEAAFEGTKYKLLRKPKHLNNLYSSVKLSDETLKAIYNPTDVDLKKKKWGVAPDFAIENTETGKILFGEIKRQDGWVEGKKPSAGRGNVHERSCKLFTPGLMKVYKEIGKIDSDNILPFWVVFEGDITRDPKRVREITYWYDSFTANYFFWRPGETAEPLVKHFNDKLKQYLD